MDDKDFEKLAKALKEALTYDGTDRPALVARIPVICNDIRSIKESVQELKDNQKWVTRLIIGAVILALIGLVLKGGI